MYLFSRKYNLQNLLTNLKTFIKNNSKQILSNIEFKKMLSKYPEISYEILSYILEECKMTSHK